MIFHCIPRSTNVVCASPFWWIEELEKIIDANAMVIIFSIWAHVGTNPISNILKLIMVFSNIQHIFLPGPTLIIGFPPTKDTLWMILASPISGNIRKLPCRGPYPQLPGWPPRAQELSACCHGFPT